MGNCSSNTNPSSTIDPQVGYSDEKLKEKFDDYIFRNDFQDFVVKRYNMNDKVFCSIKKEENKILENYYISQKDEFKKSMDSYLQKQNLNFVPRLTKQIIDYEGGREIIEQNIKQQIQDIKNDEDIFKINYLTVMIIGLCGSGKSTLVNSILKLNGEKAAPEGYGKPVTQDMTKLYKNKKEVPYLRLIDTRGVELQKGWNVKAIEDQAVAYIKKQISLEEINDFVHCIWYCVSTTRFQEDEIKLAIRLIASAGNSKIPIIIVLTQAVNTDLIREMTKYIKKSFDDVVDVIAKRIPIGEGRYLESRGLDKLLELTILKSQKDEKGILKRTLMKKITLHIKKNLSDKNESNKGLIIRQMMRETFENDIANQDFKDYVVNIYYYILCYFLNKNSIGNRSTSLIKKSEFNNHKNNFLSFCQQNENRIIEAVTKNFSYEFLDLQARKEKEFKNSVDINNKRDLIDFINTTKKFLIDNFNYFASKYYINYVIYNISAQLTTSFQIELNNILENLMNKVDIQELIAICFDRKFIDFSEYVKNHSMTGKNYYASYNDNKEIPWIGNYETIKNDNNDIIDDDVQDLKFKY